MMKHRSKLGTRFMASRKSKSSIGFLFSTRPGASNRLGSRPSGFPFSAKPGTSLLVALGLTTIIVLVSIGVTTVIISSIRDSANVTAATQSYYASEGALEKGLLENANHGIGFTSPAAPVDYSGGQCAQTPNSPCYSICLADPNGQSCLACIANNCPGKSPVTASYTISGQVPVAYDDGSYGIPAPGTGNAGANAAGQQSSVAGCDRLHPFTTDQFYFDPATQNFSVTNPNGTLEGPYDYQDHPCNWGKIKVGETVVIPLYYTCGPSDQNCTPGDPVNLFDAAIQNQNLRIKLRTACTDGKIFCSHTARPDLNDTKGDTNYNGNDPIVSWEVSGQSEDGEKTYTLEPIVAYNFVQSAWVNPTSIFYEAGLLFGINSARSNGTYEPFPNFLKARRGVDANGCQGIILNFLTNKSALTGYPSASNCADTSIWTSQNIKKPVLKLTVIHSLEDTQNSTVPYLEYQILTENTSAPPTDVMQTITAEGYSGSFKQVLQVNVPQESGLPAYVIQQ